MTECDADDLISPADRGRWDGEIVGARTETIEYRGREFVFRLQEYAEGGVHVQLLADADRPPWAREMIEYMRAQGGMGEGVAEMLCRVWDVSEAGREVEA